jgi:tetratricopeptide (TPR) repeat protein
VDDQVTLEAYAEENRALIHNSRNDEAIAICKHILNYYPKHIDSYRQMGEAFLEKEEYDYATDMFRRVLSADPENVIAYVGLASIFEQQHLIEEAVWHLERANEITPGNFEIQKELLRMYSEAAKPRQRVKLSPAGLARLYDQEGLYSQAIQELRAIADESSTRFDARVALAETLWHAGRIRESADTAQDILNSLPYCLKANLIVGAAWKESGLPDSATYLSHAQELDPTNKVAVRLFGARSPLAATDISVPRYIEGMPPPPIAQPAPAVTPATEAVKPTEESSPELADFFSETPTAEAAPSAETTEAETAKPDLPGANLPSWLLSETPESEAETTQAQEPAETGSIGGGTPSWLAGVEPTETTSTEETPSAEAESEKLPTWLEGAEETVEPKPAEEEKSVPSWLAGQASAESAEQAPAETTEVESEKLPVWMEDSGQPEASLVSVEEAQAAEPEPSETVPDWLRALQSAPAEEVTPAPEEETAPIEDYAAPATEETKPVEEPAAAQKPAEVVSEEQPATDAAAETLRDVESPAPPPAPTAPPIVVEMPGALPAAAETPSAQPAAPKRKRQPKGYPRLIQAREHRDADRIGDALLEYDWLVQHAPRLVNDVIDDLEIVTARADAPLEAHRILGDAYTRADRLSDALQRYQFVLDHTTTS